jgi:signal-transduction protein with cAMP-binding, CBS, and nucleotidyltransferase domain
MSVRLNDIMKKHIISVETSETVREAAQRMVEHHTSSVLVTIGSEPVGIVTKTDIIRKVTAKGISSLEVKVSDIMSSPLITTESRTLIGDASLEMQAKNVRRLLVTENGRIVGIVSQKDLQENVLKILLAFMRSGPTT